ncbi:malate synthase A [Ornithinimicrobium cryptoxanthini]|uniref:Malate synthase n=1 Tax=Ornithinimicrobium cryptoxanthini TaxID=2934161 RepID=A0ABY4YG55_9MICO|nr:malate synthase A [Ornithinimicrobium cryptoxanthini]USQ75751.1 malate synthase A [Ornithinimicrobium cryptoxanthini]
MTTSTSRGTNGAVQVRGSDHPRFAEILTPEALDFVRKLDGEFAGRRAELLQARRARQHQISAGREELDFLPETRGVREHKSWRVAEPAPGLTDRRAEMTGPASRKLTVNALNSGARVWMADLEDATAPTWFNVIDGQVNLFDAIRGQVDFTDENGKEYAVGGQTPTIVLRPRGWHLCEKHLSVDGRPLPASLVDFGLYFFHNAQELIERGAGPYFYLPKLESHLEARLWNDIFVMAQDLMGIPQGTIRATVLIETVSAAFEMEEILYELRDHSSGLNAGRWDYIFSYIRTFAQRGPEFVLPERAEVTMTTPLMRAYTELLVKTCHKRGAHAIGGMAAFVPDRTDEAASAAALDKIRADKEREAADGFDGSWVAHPALVPTCTEVFDQVLGENPDQRQRQRPEVEVTASDLLTGLPDPTVTEAGVRTNITVSLRYLAAWTSGTGAVAIDNLMEDAATVEISRGQLWQWIRNRTPLDDLRVVTRQLVADLIEEEAGRLTAEQGPEAAEPLARAREVLEYVALGEYLPGFFTNYAYVRYLIDAPMTGPLDKEDLRMSENVPGAGQKEDAA